MQNNIKYSTISPRCTNKYAQIYYNTKLITFHLLTKMIIDSVIFYEFVRVIPICITDTSLAAFLKCRSVCNIFCTSALIRISRAGFALYPSHMSSWFSRTPRLIQPPQLFCLPATIILVAQRARPSGQCPFHRGASHYFCWRCFTHSGCPELACPGYRRWI